MYNSSSIIIKRRKSAPCNLDCIVGLWGGNFIFTSTIYSGRLKLEEPLGVQISSGVPLWTPQLVKKSRQPGLLLVIPSQKKRTNEVTDLRNPKNRSCGYGHVVIWNTRRLSLFHPKASDWSLGEPFPCASFLFPHGFKIEITTKNTKIAKLIMAPMDNILRLWK